MFLCVLICCKKFISCWNTVLICIKYLVKWYCCFLFFLCVDPEAAYFAFFKVFKYLVRHRSTNYSTLFTNFATFRKKDMIQVCFWLHLFHQRHFANIVFAQPLMKGTINWNIFWINLPLITRVHFYDFAFAVCMSVSTPRLLGCRRVLHVMFSQPW